MVDISKIASQLGKLGGQASAKSRLAGKTKNEKSELMRELRYSKKNKEDGKKMTKELVSNLNRNVLSEQPGSKT